MKDIEIEVQLRVSKTDKLVAFLEKEAEFTGESYQKDEYLVPPHRDFVATKPVKEWLRVRESDKKSSVNYKNWHYDESGRSTHCDEYETPIEDVDQMRKIFAAIDIKPLITVEKKRKTYRYKDYEVALDEITDLGNFVEVEYKGEDPNVVPTEVTAGMIAWLKEIDCGVIERNYVGYPFMLLYPAEVKFEVV
jgi:adenylate cyclase class 2